MVSSNNFAGYCVSSFTDKNIATKRREAKEVSTVISLIFRRGALERKEMFLCNSTDMDVAEHFFKPLCTLTYRFLSSSVDEQQLGKLHDIATQWYFHDMRDEI